MIMVFEKNGDLSVVYDISTLKEEDKIGGIVFDKLPELEHRDGFVPILKLVDNKLDWEYEEIIEEKIEE